MCWEETGADDVGFYKPGTYEHASIHCRNGGFERTYEHAEAKAAAQRRGLADSCTTGAGFLVPDASDLHPITTMMQASDASWNLFFQSWNVSCILFFLQTYIIMFSCLYLDNTELRMWIRDMLLCVCINKGSRIKTHVICCACYQFIGPQ
jgi:hypothetical protein